MEPQISGDEKFNAFYSQSENAPRWFCIIFNIVLGLVQVGAVYAIAKLESIEAALLIYVLFRSVMHGMDQYAEQRNLNMFLWNDKQLEKRVSSLEKLLKKLDS